VERLHRSRRFLSLALFMFTTAAPMTSEATVKTTVITPKRYPPGLTIAKVERLTLARRQVLDRTGVELLPTRSFDLDSTWWRRAEIAEPKRVDLYCGSATLSPAHIAWVGVDDRKVHFVGRTTSNDLALVQRMYDDFEVWQRPTPIVVTVGAESKLAEHVRSLLPTMDAGWYSHVLRIWDAGKLGVVASSIDDELVHFRVRATTEHMGYGRTARHQAEGSLSVRRKDGWPARLELKGQWSRPVPVLAGDSTYHGTLELTATWTYASDPPPAARLNEGSPTPSAP